MATRKVQFELDVPDNGRQVDAEAKEAYVMQLLRQHEISQGKSAELLNVSRWKLVDIMAKHDVPAIDYDPEELEEEQRALNKSLG